ncbi:MAG: MATE family efflux transporter [Bacteroidales bacterium]|jgi:putative MATE family efflux protein|nr:MATE family efflux transporter [Bacteroidales bacterium]
MKDFTKGKISKQIFYFALPIVFSSLLQQLYSIVDSIFIGHYVGKQGLAAIGASFPLIFALISFVIGIGSGSTVVISQYLGAKRMESVKKAVETMYIFMFFGGIILTVIGVFISPYIFILTNLPADVIPEAIDYIQVYLMGTVLFFGFAGTNAILRGLGDSKTPFYFTLIATITNILLDWLFIAELGMGVKGAALGTIMAQGGAFFTAIIYLNRNHELISIYINKLSFDRKIFKESVRIGLPTGFQQTIVSFGMIALFGIVNGFGTDVVAAYSIALRIESIPLMLAMSFAAAIAPFVGQNVGADQMLRVKKGYRSALLMTNAISILISILFLIAPRLIIQVFTNDKAVIEIGVEYMYIVAPFYLIFSTMFILNGTLRGAGATLIPMFITLIALWAVRIPVSWILSDTIGRTGIWWGVPIGWFVGMVISYIYYKTGYWKKSKIKIKPIPVDARVDLPK